MDLAIRTRDPEMVALLLDRGASPDRSDGDRSPLEMASLLGDAEIVALLMRHGADADDPGPRERCALHIAAGTRGSLAVVGALLAGGASPNPRDERGMTPLVLAVLASQTSIVEALVAAGADVNTRVSSMRNAPIVAVAVRRGLPRSTQVMVEAGADPDASDDEGVTARQLARGQPVVSRALEHGVRVRARRQEESGL